MARGGSDLDLEDEQWIKDEVDIEEHELLQHPRVRAALPHLALGGGLPAPAESQLPPAESSDSAGIEALPDTRQADPERDVKLEPGLLLGKGCNEVTETEKDALYVDGRWFNSRVALVDCGAALRHSDCYCKECGRLCSSRSALLCHQQAHCDPEVPDPEPESSVSEGIEAVPDTRQAAPERDIKLEPRLLLGKGCNEVAKTEKDALYVDGRWFNSRVALVDCGAALRHSDCYCKECGRLCSSRSALLCHQQAHCDPEVPDPEPESSVSEVIEAVPDTRQAAPERDIKLEPRLLLGKGCNEVAKTEKDALYVDGRWFHSRVALVDCGAALRHSDCYCKECGRLCSSRSALLCHQQAHCAPEYDDAPRPPESAGDKAARRYECDNCHYTSKDRKHMVRHLKQHTGEKPFKCNLCGYRSGESSNLTTHMRTHTGNKPFKCNVCDFRCSLKGNLSRHVRTHTGEKPFKCNLCDFRSGTQGYLSKHIMISHIRGKPFKCNLCDYKSADRSKLTKHMRIHTGEKPFKCSVCEYRCKYKGTLSSHIFHIHTGEKPFKCDFCDYRNVSRRDMARHLRTHTGEKPFKCDLCDYRSASRGNLTFHMTSHTGEKPFQCSVCEYKCSRKGHLSRHMRTHTGEKPFKCNVCQHRFNEKYQLNSHMRTHTGEKPFKCYLCDYRSASQGHLSEHMRTHTGEKPFKCNFCDHKSALRSSLINHLRTHTGEKPFKCDFCDYRSAHHTALTGHLRTHTGEKPFKCNLCDYRSAHRTALNYHMTSHTGVKPFKCSLCEYRCNQRSNINRHMRTHSRREACKVK